MLEFAVESNNMNRLFSKQLIVISICIGLVAIISFFATQMLREYCIVEDKVRGTVYYPIVTLGDIDRMVNKAGSRHAAVTEYGRDQVRLYIDEMPYIGFFRPATTFLFFLLYSLTFGPSLILIGIWTHSFRRRPLPTIKE